LILKKVNISEYRNYLGHGSYVIALVCCFAC